MSVVLGVLGVSWFIIKLPFRIIALVMSFIIGVISVMLQLAMSMGMALISVFNILLLIGFIATIWAKDWHCVTVLVILLALEAIIIMLCSILNVVAIVVKDSLLSFGIGRKYESELSFFE